MSLDLTRDLRGRVIERPKRFGLALAASTLDFDLGEAGIGDLLRDHVVAGERFEQAGEGDRRASSACPCAP